MKKAKFFLLFSLILLVMMGLSVVSANDDSISDNSTHHIGENDNPFLKINSYSSLKYSLGDSENNDLSDGTDLNSDSSNSDNSDDDGSKDSDFDDLGADGYNGSDSNSSDVDSNGTNDNDSTEDNGSNEIDDGGNESDNNESVNETIDFSNRSDYLFLVSPDNFNIFFDEDNVLRMDYGGCTLVFEGNFTDMGIIDIAYPYTKIAARDDLFNNTAFRVSVDNVQLTNLNIVLDKDLEDNDYAGILVLANNVSIYNVTMNYTVPDATNGFLVYSEGNGGKRLENLSLINNTFYFDGNNLHSGWDYGIFIDNTDNALLYGNDINSSLPLRNVDWSYEVFGGISMDAVATLAVQSSNNLRLSSNNIYTNVDSGVNGYPTLDSCIFYNCKNLTIDNNSIEMVDIDSKDGKNNYLYATDFYFCDDVEIVSNDINVFTTGGQDTNGAAYPIQINGPANNVKIAFNNLTTFNYGPNLGIYSQNHYGDTQIDIISNFINVTGFASSHMWALVAGIEVQDSHDIIWNNTIIVTNIGNYSSSANVYGISYSQNTDGNHTYNIQYNNVTTNGRYAIELKGVDSLVVDSIISNNVLVAATSNGTRALNVEGNKKNITTRNNTDGTFKNVLDESKYPEWLKNFLADSTVQTKDFVWVTTSVNNASNGTGFANKTGNSTGLDDEGGNGTIGNSTNGTSSLIEGNGTENGTSNGTEGNSTDLPSSGESGNGTGNGTNTNSTDNPTNATGPVNPDNPINNTDPEPINSTEPVNNTDSEPINSTEPVNNTDSEPINSTEPVNNTDSEPINSTEPVNNTDSEPINSTEPVNNTDSEPINSTEGVNITDPLPDVPKELVNNTGPVNTTEPINSTVPLNDSEKENQTITEPVHNDTNQTIMNDDNEDPKESHEDNPDEKENPSVDDEKSNPGESGSELVDSDDSTNEEESQNEENQEEDSQENSEDSKDLSSPEVGDSHSDSSSSPGFSGASAANDAYELDKKIEDVVSKTVDYMSLAGICIAALLLISIGYMRQKDIEDED